MNKLSMRRPVATETAGHGHRKEGRTDLEEHPAPTRHLSLSSFPPSCDKRQSEDRCPIPVPLSPSLPPVFSPFTWSKELFILLYHGRLIVVIYSSPEKRPTREATKTEQQNDAYCHTASRFNLKRSANVKKRHCR